MRKIFVIAISALIFTSVIQVSPAHARGRRHTPADKEVTGTVTVTKSGTTVTAVEIKTSDSTVYEVKLDSNGEALAKNYDGKSVTVKAKLGMIDGKKELTVEKIEGVTSDSKKKSK